MAELDTVEGIASLMATARVEANEYGKVEIREITDPTTGIAALVAIDASGVSEVPAAIFDGYRVNPLRIKGTAAMLSLASLIDITNRFKDSASAIFADDNRKAPSLTAVLDYHLPVDDVGADASDIARWAGHKATFTFPLSDEWQAWHATNKTAMSMTDFAAFLEDRIVDVLTLERLEDMPADAQTFIKASGGLSVVATPTKLIELSRGLKIYENSAIEEVVNLASGEGGLRFNAEHTTGDGKPLKVPSIFILALPVFRSGETWRMVARLRYRKATGGVVFWYELWRADRVFDTAFTEACAEVGKQTELPVFLGKPQA